MKPRNIIAIAAALCLNASAQVNDPDANGYILRAQMMSADANYIGCLDQLTQALRLPLTPAQRQEALLLQAKATVHTHKREAKTLLQQWLAAYPAAAQRNEALMALADCYYGSDYPLALATYLTVDPTSLPYDDSLDYYYRTAYCYLQAGDLDKARVLFDKLDGTEAYGMASRFYRAYIAYAKGDMRTAETLFEAARSGVAPGNMADYYLSQIYYGRAEYQRALNTAKALLDNRAASQQHQAEAYRIAGESAFHLGDYQQAQRYLDQYVKLTQHPQPSALYVLGLFAYNQADYAKAVELLRPATEQADAMSQSAYLYIGQALLKEGDYDGAILAFDKALNMDFDPKVQETAYYNYAVASMQGGKVPFGNSVSTFESFLHKFPDSPYAPEAQKYIVASYINSHNYAAALQSIRSMAKPTDDTNRAKLQALYMLGSQALSAGNVAEAATMLAEARTLARYDAKVAQEATLGLAEAYYAQGRHADAATLLREYLTQVPADAANRQLANYDLGYALFAQKKYADAATAFAAATARGSQLPTPIMADAYDRLGDCYYYSRDFAKAEQAYDKALSLYPEAGDYAMLQKGLMLGYQRLHQQKIALLNQMQAQYPQSALIPDALLEMTESYIQLGDNQSAIDTYRQLVDTYPATAQGRQGYLQMALTMLNAGQKANAIDAYKQVVIRYPSSDEAAQAVDQLKRIYAADGRLGEFMAFINNVPNAPKMEASEADALSWEVAEKEYIVDGKTQKLKAYVADYADGANRAKALSYLLESAQAAADTDAAYAYASEIADRYPDSAVAPEALLAKGAIEMQQGKGNLALRSYTQLQERASTPYMLNQARMGIARAQLELGDNNEAIAAAEAAILSGQLDQALVTEAYYIRGMAHYRADDDPDEARFDWQHAAANTHSPYGMESAYMLAQSYYADGDLATAEKKAKEVTDADTPYTYWVARGFILLSDIYNSQGNKFKAQQYLKSLRENYPGTEADIFQMIDQRID